MTDRDGLNRNREEILASSSDPYDKEDGAKLWGVALFGLIGIGATATIYSGQIGRLLRRVDRFCGFSQQTNRTRSSSKGEASRSSRKPFEEEAWRKYEKEMKQVFGQLLQRSADFWVRSISQQINRTQSPWTWSRSWTWSWKWDSSFRKASHEEAWRKHMRRMREEYEDEMERVERIRRMQSVFHRDRNKSKKSYESWTESGPGTYHQHSQRNDWYWKAGTSFRDQQTNRRETPKSNPNYKLSHHYAVLGLNRSPAEPYTEAEIKSAFRAKALQLHPDQNQDDKEAAEAKFKEVLISYEAIRSERNRK